MVRTPDLTNVAACAHSAAVAAGGPEGELDDEVFPLEQPASTNATAAAAVRTFRILDPPPRRSEPDDSLQDGLQESLGPGVLGMTDHLARRSEERRVGKDCIYL